MEAANGKMQRNELDSGNNRLTEVDSSLLESPGSSCVSTDVNIENLHHIRPDVGSSKCGMPFFGATLSCMSSYSTEGAGLLAEDLTANNHQFPNSNVITGINTWEDCRQGPWIHFDHLESGTTFWKRDGGPTMTSFRKGVSQMPLGLQEHSFLPAKQFNGAPHEISGIVSYDKNMQTNMPPPRDNQSNILPSSSFSDFSSKQSTKGKEVLCRFEETSTGYAVEMAQIMDNKDLLDITRERVDFRSPESYSAGVSLRDWLNARAGKIDKVERLNLFTQIVQLVDVAHSKGIGLQDFCLSKFKVLQPNMVIYSNSSAQEELQTFINQNVNGKRALEQDKGIKLNVKQRNLGKGIKPIREHLQFSSLHGSSSESVNDISSKITQGGDYNDYKAHQLLEKTWYNFPEELNEGGLLSMNIYSLGVLLFELLCSFESSEMHLAAMIDLRNRILPPIFISEYPQETGFILWLLHPQPSSRPTTWEILQSELIRRTYSESVLSSDDKIDDAESELLLNFLRSLEEQKQKEASALLQNLGFLETDVKEVNNMHVRGTLSASNMITATLMRNISQLERAYFDKRAHVQTTKAISNERSDKELLANCDNCFCSPIGNMDPTIGKNRDYPGDFLQDVCMFAKYSKLEVCGAFKNVDLLNTAHVITSLSFDRDEDYIATAGVSKKIKIYDFLSLLGESVDINYPAVELSNKSKLSCVCWNKYLKNYLASADYDGMVQLWDTSIGRQISEYIEHEERAWCVDFSQVDPTKFASGSDDSLVKLWNINEKKSTGTIKNQANVCCIQFSPFSSHLLAFGSADCKIYCYDMRHTRIPWCVVTGHKKAVSYVRFLDSETLVSASTDGTLKLWDLKNTSFEGVSSNACSMTYSGHTNEKNFVGLAVSNGYIACGSETNEVYLYYRALPMSITSYKFDCVQPISGEETTGETEYFVSSVCWREKSNMVVAANSIGSMKVLQVL